MLVLTRKRSEVIQIGDNVLVKVLQMGRNTVKIGIEAPLHLRVLRGEICQEAPSSPPTPLAKSVPADAPDPTAPHAVVYR